MDKKSIGQEFREFALRGSVIDLAIGIIIGAAFTSVVQSLVDDLVLPFVGIFNRVDFSELTYEIAGVTFGVGRFLNALVSFFIVAMVVFLLVKLINRLHRKQAEAPAAPSEDVLLLREIRDALKK